MSEKPEPLRLADVLETLSPLGREAAAELRRLYYENEYLKDGIAELELKERAK